MLGFVGGFTTILMYVMIDLRQAAEDKHTSIAGAILKSRAHNTRTSATDVRELVSMTIDRTSDIGRVVNSATEATGPRDAIARSGAIR